jgi:hypothetical protein
MTEFFGEAGGEAWGELTNYDFAAESVTDDMQEGEYLPDSIDIGGGMRLVISKKWFRDIMHSPEITARVADRAEAIATEANSLAVVEGAEYTYFVSNRPENIRARARVKPANAAAYVDDKLNATLLKAVANVGSDPYPWQVGESGEWEYRGVHREGEADVESEPGPGRQGPMPEEPVGPGYFDATRAGDTTQRKDQRE